MGRNEDKTNAYLKRLDKVSPLRIEVEVFYRDSSMYVALVSLDLVLEAKYSRKNGARYNPPGTFAALYLANSRIMGQLEVAHHGRDDLNPNGLLLQKPTARLSAPLAVSAGVLDLTDPAVLKELGLTESEINCSTKEWQDAQHTDSWMPCQCIGLAAYRSGKFDGILFRSALPEDVQKPMISAGIVHSDPPPTNIVVIMDDSKTSEPRGSYCLIDPIGPPFK